MRCPAAGKASHNLATPASTSSYARHQTYDP